MNRPKTRIRSVTDWTDYLDRRPIIVALAGPNGAGKTTFYNAHLKTTGLPFLNVDILVDELGIENF